MASFPPVILQGKRWRWSQFGLRTLLGVVAVVCVLVGWFCLQLRIVMERREMLRGIEGSGGMWLAPIENRFNLDANSPDRIHLSFVRELLGDQPVGAVYFPRGTSTQQQRQVELICPEAQCQVMPELLSDLQETEITDIEVCDTLGDDDQWVIHVHVAGADAGPLWKELKRARYEPDPWSWVVYGQLLVSSADKEPIFVGFFRDEKDCVAFKENGNYFRGMPFDKFRKLVKQSAVK